jgi:hypothetical protein
MVTLYQELVKMKHFALSCNQAITKTPYDFMPFMDSVSLRRDKIFLIINPVSA